MPYAYQWQYCTNAESDCASVASGGAASAYALFSPYENLAAPDRNLWFTEYTGNHIGHMAIGYTVDTALPTISGTASHGQTLSATNGTWTSTLSPTYTYQWQDCNAGGYSRVAISGATSSSRLVATTDEGDNIRVVVTAASSSSSASASSAVTTTVT
jgi:hypothetical protein